MSCDPVTYFTLILAVDRAILKKKENSMIDLSIGTIPGGKNGS
jgi:hypothetical protein